MTDKPDSLFLLAASYGSVDQAVSDYEAIKALGEVLDDGQAGLIVAYAANMADQVAANIKAANRMVSKETDMAADALAQEIKEAESATATPA